MVETVGSARLNGHANRAYTTTLAHQDAGSKMQEEETILDLAGEWRVRLDRDDTGVANAWPEGLGSDERCRLPGSIQEQDLGDDVSVQTPWVADISRRDPWYTSPKFERYRQPGAVKIPYFLQPLKHYVGVAWFEREVRIADDLPGRRLMLHLERTHWQTRCWLDGVEVEVAHDSLSVPHEYDLGTLAPGNHRLTLRVDNRMVHGIGPNSHSVSDHTQGAWNGVVGRVELREVPVASLRRLQVFAEPNTKSIRILSEVSGAKVGAKCVVTIDGVKLDTQEVTDGQTTLDVSLPAPLSTWDEFAPNLHELDLALEQDGAVLHRRQISFGVRQVSTRGTQILVNGRPTFLRGTLDCCIFPLTGYPPTDVPSWRRIMRTVKEYGLNHVRFHSYCPPEAAFVAADDAGVYLQVECASWANQGATVGDGASVDQWLYDEADRIITAYGNHPSFVMLAYGNEPAGDRHVEWLTRWVEHWQRLDPRRLHTSGAGWPAIPPSDFHSIWEPRIQHWGAGLKSRINSREPETTTDYRDHVAKHQRPIVTHEIGQWCVFPNLEEEAKCTGAYRATNFGLVRDSLAEKEMLPLAPGFVHASGKLQAICYKEEIESQLRTPGLGGFQLLGLQDFPGQGTALVGVVDAYWDPKEYVSAAEFRRFCSATVLLARLPQRTWTADQTFTAEIEIAHYGEKPLNDVLVEWRLETPDGRQVVASGTLQRPRIECGDVGVLGTIRVALAEAKTPAHLRLYTRIRGSGVENEWGIWVYPARAEPQSGPLVTMAIDDAFADATASGRPVLLSLGGHDPEAEVALGFSSIFWNTLWTQGQPPHTLGILCDPRHGALAQFPTESHSNWQWSEPIRHARCLMLDHVPRVRIEPLVRVIDDWNQNRSLGLLVEIRVGKSRVIVSGVDLAGDLSARPVSRQLHQSIMGYLADAKGDSGALVELSEQELRSLVSRSTGQD